MGDKILRCYLSGLMSLVVGKEIDPFSLCFLCGKGGGKFYFEISYWQNIFFVTLHNMASNLRADIFF